MRQHRRTVSIARGAIASLATLLLLAGASALFALAQRNSAREQRDAALSRQLAVQGQDLATSDPTLSSLLSVAAYKLGDTFEARSGLLRSDERWSTVERVLGTRRRAVRAIAGVPLDNVVRDIGFTADGRTLMIGWLDRTVVWDVAHSARRAVLPGRRGIVTGAAISPDGRLVATGGETISDGGTVVLWNVAARRRTVDRRRATGRSPPVESLVFPRTGGCSLTADLGTVNLWDVAGRRRVARIKRGGPFTSLALSRDSRTLAIGTSGAGTILWDVPRAGASPRCASPMSSRSTALPSARTDERSRWETSGHESRCGTLPAAPRNEPARPCRRRAEPGVQRRRQGPRVGRTRSQGHAVERRQAPALPHPVGPLQGRERGRDRAASDDARIGRRRWHGDRAQVCAGTAYAVDPSGGVSPPPTVARIRVHRWAHRPVGRRAPARGDVARSPRPDQRRDVQPRRAAARFERLHGQHGCPLGRRSAPSDRAPGGAGAGRRLQPGRRYACRRAERQGGPLGRARPPEDRGAAVTRRHRSGAVQSGRAHACDRGHGIQRHALESLTVGGSRPSPATRTTC